MKKTLCLLFVTSLMACGGATTVSRVNTNSGSNNAAASAVDCTGFQSDLKVPYGIVTPTGQSLRGQTFAKVVAVDSQDGRMKVSILPPDGQSSFVTSLISELEAEGYTIRIISCKENPSSVVSGFSTTGVCNSKGPINLVGDTSVTSSEFLPAGFTFNSSIVHATSIVSTTYTKPDFIMITAGLTTSEVGDFMIAFGSSPYYNGCYNK